MECCVIGCKKGGKYIYKIREAQFRYCKKHSVIPETIIIKINLGGYFPSKGIGR